MNAESPVLNQRKRSLAVSVTSNVFAFAAQNAQRSMRLAKFSFGRRISPSVGILTIEGLDRDALDGCAVDASRVDAVAVRVRTRHIKRFDTTHGTEKMLCHAGIERVSS